MELFVHGGAHLFELLFIVVLQDLQLSIHGIAQLLQLFRVGSVSCLTRLATPWSCSCCVVPMAPMVLTMVSVEGLLRLRNFCPQLARRPGGFLASQPEFPADGRRRLAAAACRDLAEDDHQQDQAGKRENKAGYNQKSVMGRKPITPLLMEQGPTRSAPDA